MPNMFGGDQFHPAYHGGVAKEIENDPRQHLIGEDHYRIIGEGNNMKVTVERLDGTGHTFPPDSPLLPTKVRRAIRRLRREKG